MNRSTILRTLCVLGIVAVLGLAGVGLEHIVAGLSQARGSAAPVAAQPMATATVAASFPAQLQVVAQPTATATVVPPPAQVQVEPEASDSMLAAPGTRIKVEGRITAVNAAAGTITVQDDDRPATMVALGTARGTYYLGQKVKVYGLLTSAGSNGATVQAQFISVDSPDGDNDGD